MTERILGTGIDLVENERIREMMEKWRGRFLDRVFLPEEQAYCESKAAPWLYYAGRFAVKEAVSKAFGTGIGNSLGWQDIEVVRDHANGAPSVRFGARGRELAAARGVSAVWISLSHTRHFAVAHAVLVSGSEPGREFP